MNRIRIRINLDAFMRKNGVSTETLSEVLGMPVSTVSTMRTRGYVFDPEMIQTILDQDRGWDCVPLFEEASPDDIRFDAAIYRRMIRERDERIVELTKKVTSLTRALELARGHRK